MSNTPRFHSGVIDLLGAAPGLPLNSADAPFTTILPLAELLPKLIPSAQVTIERSDGQFREAWPGSLQCHNRDWGRDVRYGSCHRCSGLEKAVALAF